VLKFSPSVPLTTATAQFTWTTPGTYKFCYKLADSAWGHVANNNLIVLAPPSFSPVVGIAGTLTRLTFTGASNGDIIVLAAGVNCSTIGAHTAIANASSLGKRTLEQMKVNTLHLMTYAGVLRACFATQESGANSTDDFALLPLSFTQRAPPVFSPSRMIVGAQQEMNISNTATGDLIKWFWVSENSAVTVSQEPNYLATCETSVTHAVANRTVDYSVQASSHLVNIHSSTLASGGYWSG
jgi:hypothetical protein